MADRRAECQRYLTEFRVIELKELLKLIGLSQRGRKSDLFQRANELLIHGSPKVQHQIREVYQRSHKGLKQRPLRYSGKVLYNQQYSDMKGMMQHHTPKSQFGSSPVGKSERSTYIPHPDVKFKPHPFYNVLDMIIRPTTLLSTAVTSNGSNSMRVQFHLSPHQVQKIVSSRTSQGDYGIQILLRLARNECSCEQEDFYPRQCYVKVNSNYCTLPGYNPHLSLRPDYKRNGSPIDITNMVKTSASQTNDVIFYWISDILYPQGFCVEITLVNSLSASDLLQELKLRGIRSPDVSRALVREKLAVDRDSEISATSLRVSLLCPLGKLRMTHPCRSQMCTHLQCFDASIYLQMNERKARWVCPVCDKVATTESLVVDGLFKEICEQSTCNDIEFYSDGSWHPISSKDVPTHSLTPERKLVTLDSLSPVTITDSIDNASPAPDDSSKGEGTMSNPIVIDEKEDEEEELMEEEERPKEQPVSSPSSSGLPVVSASSHTPHIVDPSHHNFHQRSSHGREHRDKRREHRDSGGMPRSVVVKRRYSSTTEGGAESSHECCTPLASSSTTAISADTRNHHLITTTTTTTPFPIPEYDPTLPYLDLPYLAQESVLASSSSADNPLAAIGSSGGDLSSLDADIQHLPSLNLDDSNNMFTFIHPPTNSRIIARSGITLVDD